MKPSLKSLIRDPLGERLGVVDVDLVAAKRLFAERPQVGGPLGGDVVGGELAGVRVLGVGQARLVVQVGADGVAPGAEGDRCGPWLAARRRR